MKTRSPAFNISVFLLDGRLLQFDERQRPAASAARSEGRSWGTQGKKLDKPAHFGAN
jgi:hypothetical protein